MQDDHCKNKKSVEISCPVSMFSWRDWSGHYKMTSISFRATSFRFRAKFFHQFHFEHSTFTQKRKPANHRRVHFPLCTRQNYQLEKEVILISLLVFRLVKVQVFGTAKGSAYVSVSTSRYHPPGGGATPEHLTKRTCEANPAGENSPFIHYSLRQICSTLYHFTFTHIVLHVAVKEFIRKTLLKMDKWAVLILRVIFDQP